MVLDGLADKASKILAENWLGHFTIPSPSLYPHQWSWDSAFTAIGNTHYDVSRSIVEIEHLFDAQWKNGMVPHIVFNEKATSYFPSPTFYDSQKSSDAPRHVKTSGMTQPSVHAIAAYHIYQNHPDQKEAKEFLKRIFPKLEKFHEYLMTVRDPERMGAITVMHPWESGMDNSPIWDEALKRLVVSDIPEYQRKDLINVSDPSQRPDHATYDRFIFLLLTMKKHDYNHIDMYDDYPFKIKSSTSTSLLYASNNFMLKIADIIDEDKTRILDWQSRIKKNFDKTFCPNLPKDPLYYDYDLIAEEHILKQTVGSITPIYSGIPSKEHADRIVNMLGDSKFCGTSCHVQMVPSTSLHEKEYTPQLYWRGPVWINVNWLIWRGLQNYGYKEKAEQIKEGVIELVKEHGFYEYYDATTGEGYGAQNFSWTAALLIDMIKDLGVGTSS